VANTGYTRNLTFTVNDKQIKKATDRLFQSLDRIEKKLDLIAGRGSRTGFKRLEIGADNSTKKVNLLSAAVGKTKKTFSTLNTTLRTFAGAVNVLNNVRLGFKEAIVETLNFTNALRDQEVVLKRMERATAGSPYMRNAMAGGDRYNPRGGTHPYRYFNEDGKGTLGGSQFIPYSSRNPKQGRRRGTWQEELRDRMGIRRQALERSGTGFGSFSRDVSFHEAFRGSRGFDYGGMTSGQTAVDKSIKRHEKHLAKINKATNKTASILGKQAAASLALPPGIGTQYAAPIGPMPATLGQRAGKWGNNLGFGANANPQGVFANSRGRGGRIAGALSSGMIGGGFPLLFGQGGLGALGGGIGGLAGGALGGGFGFGFSIVGTALASAAQDAINFQESIDKVNNSIRRTGSESLLTAKGVKNLATRLDMTKEEVLAASAAFAQFNGESRLALTSTYGKNPAGFYGLAEANDAVKVLEQINKLRKEDNGLSDEKARTVLEILNTEGAIAARIELRRSSEERLIESQNLRNIRFKDIMRAERDASLPGKGKSGGDPLYYGEERVRLKQLEWEQTDKLLEKEREWIQLQEHSLFIAQTRSEIQKLMDPMYQLRELSVSVGNSFAESFKGIINGSMTAQQALANLFQKTANHFLDMAAQMIAKQIQMKILGIALNFFTGGAQANLGTGRDGTFGLGTHGSGIPTGAKGWGFSGKAAGGPVSGGTPYVVGEKGPELFVPGSSGNIVPNNKMGGVNIVVNVDASDSSVEGDEGQSAQLGNMLAQAIQSELVRQKRPGGLLSV